MGSERPVFIVGAPRSGTSLLRNMLNRHPSLAICGETQFKHYVYRRRRAFGDLGNLRNRQRLIDEYLSVRRMQRLGIDISRLKEKLVREATSYPAVFACLARSYAESTGKKRWGEKTPQHALIAELLCEWFPDAAILHILRDPRDTVASLQRMTWASNSDHERAHLAGMPPGGTEIVTPPGVSTGAVRDPGGSTRDGTGAHLCAPGRALCAGHVSGG